MLSYAYLLVQNLEVANGFFRDFDKARREALARQSSGNPAQTKGDHNGARHQGGASRDQDVFA